MEMVGYLSGVQGEDILGTCGNEGESSDGGLTREHTKPREG